MAEPRRWSLRRLFVPLAVGLALLSSCLTFLVLNGLTPIAPTHRGIDHRARMPPISTRRSVALVQNPEIDARSPAIIP